MADIFHMTGVIMEFSGMYMGMYMIAAWYNWAGYNEIRPVHIYIYVYIYVSRKTSRGWLNTKVQSYQYKESHCGNKTILRPSYLHNRISYTGKTTYLYWIKALVNSLQTTFSNAFSWMKIIVFLSKFHLATR